MATYQYKARDKFAKPIVGLMESDSENTIALKLKAMGYIPISITPAEERGKFQEFFNRLFKQIRPSDIIMFTWQFAALLKAGIPVLTSLNTLREETENKYLEDIIGQVARSIEAGESLSSALDKYPAVFNPLYVNMIKIGEASGTLDQVLKRLAILEEYEEKVMLRIKAATRYPVIVIMAIALGFLILTTVVIPRFAQIYAQSKVDLPIPTQILLLINALVRGYWWLLIILGALFIFLFHKLINTKRGRFYWDTFKLKIPIFGPLILKLTMSRFTRISGVLIGSGVPLFDVLGLASRGVGNVLVSNTIENIKTSVSEGKGISEPMKFSALFPPVVVQMASVGEQTGKLDELLLEVADYYDSQIDYTLNNLISLIEPILILVFGCVVLFMALGIFLPMWNLMHLFRR